MKGAKVMQKREEEQKNKESYTCPNPNCNSVFYRPKIIKHYVCPTCQTLVKMDTAIGNTKTKKRGPTEEDVKRKEAERLEAERKETEEQQQIRCKAPKPIELSQTEQPAADAEEVNKSSDSRCKHYFGYLGEREKGEEIPAGCLECRKTLDCMLSDYYRSKETVEEIKKWYPAKA